MNESEACMRMPILVTVCMAAFAVAQPHNATAQDYAPAKGLIGTWTSTAKPAKGEAPAIAPMFVVQVMDNKLTLLVAGKNEQLQHPTIYRSGRDAILLMRAASAVGRGERTIIVRPIGPDEVQFEMYMEYPEDRLSNYFYSEVFKRSK